MSRAREDLLALIERHDKRVGSLGVWQAGPDRILRILQRAAIARLNASESDALEVVPSWPLLFERLVRWSSSYPMGEGECSADTAEEAIQTAIASDSLERLKHALRVEAFDVSGSGARYRLRINKNPAVEAADILLEQLTVPRGLPAKQVPELASWIRRQGAINRPGEISADVLMAVVARARSVIEAYRNALPEGCLPREFSLGNRLTVGAAIDHWAGLVGMAMVAEEHSRATGRYESTLVWRPAHQLATELAVLAGDAGDEAAAQDLIDLLTYRPGAAGPLSAPLIPCGENLIVSPAIVSSVGVDRLLLRAVAADTSRFGRVGELLGRRAAQWAEVLRSVPHARVALGVKVRRQDGTPAGDLDVVAVDPQAKIGICIEVKWPVDAYTLPEMSKIDGIVERGSRQLDRLRSELTTGATAKFPSSWPRFDEVRWSWMIATPQQLYIGKLPAPGITATSLRYVKALPPANSLAQLATIMADPVLPREGLHWRLTPARMTVGNSRIIQDAIEIVMPTWRPSYRN